MGVRCAKMAAKFWMKQKKGIERKIAFSQHGANSRAATPVEGIWVLLLSSRLLSLDTPG